MENLATELIPKLSFRVEAGMIIVEDENEIKHMVDVIEFMIYMAIIKQQYYNRSFQGFIEVTPSWKLINLVIEYDNQKRKK